MHKFLTMEATCCGDQYHPILAQTCVPQVRNLEIEMRLEITNFAIVASDYLSNLCDPIFVVRLEMSCVRILFGRHDQDAGRGGDSGSTGRVCYLKGRPYSSSTENSCSLSSASRTACVCESGHVTAMSGGVTYGRCKGA